MHIYIYIYVYRCASVLGFGVVCTPPRPPKPKELLGIPPTLAPPLLTFGWLGMKEWILIDMGFGFRVLGPVVVTIKPIIVVSIFLSIPSFPTTQT